MTGQNQPGIEELAQLVERELLVHVSIKSNHQNDPVVVGNIPEPWLLLGRGNYAAVFCHPERKDCAMKVYAPGRPGLQEEAEVYRRLDRHPAYSECYMVGDGYLILKRLIGKTFYECIIEGIPITDQAIREIDEALDDARSLGLSPHDIHVKNVMMQNGRGVIVDVSDFLKEEDYQMWNDFKKAYLRLYRPLTARRTIRIPEVVLEAIRRGYRIWRVIRE
ncbi:serine/threonine protein kinase [Paenibacillus lentus]|uniref:serine/threonine protein kinase n=1 Tax=Paenibacillus lentus TaxID=1338368 RepID=UPI00366A140B